MTIEMYCGACNCVRCCDREDVYDHRGYVVGERWRCESCGSTDTGGGVMKTEEEDMEARMRTYPKPPEPPPETEAQVKFLLAETKAAIKKETKRLFKEPFSEACARMCEAVSDALNVGHYEVGLTVTKRSRDKYDMVLELPSHLFEGWTAGQMRSAGAPVPEHVPDCAVFTRDYDLDPGAMRFAWVELRFILGPRVGRGGDDG